LGPVPRATGNTRGKEEPVVNNSNQFAALTPQSPVAMVNSPTRDFLAWVARRPRTYAEAMEAWRSSCPRFTIWEDAIADGLIREESGGGRLGDVRIVLTPRGRALLDAG
jgi:hypothetical protein